MWIYIAGHSMDFFLLSFSFPYPSLFPPTSLPPSFSFLLPSLPPHLYLCLTFPFLCSLAGCWLSPRTFLLVFLSSSTVKKEYSVNMWWLPTMHWSAFLSYTLSQPWEEHVSPSGWKLWWSNYHGATVLWGDLRSDFLGELAAYQVFQAYPTANVSWGHWIVCQVEAKWIKLGPMLSSAVEAEAVLHRPFPVPTIPQKYHLDLTTKADLK